MTTTYKTYKWFNPRPSTITEGTAMYRDREAAAFVLAAEQCGII